MDNARMIMTNDYADGAGTIHVCRHFGSLNLRSEIILNAVVRSANVAESLTARNRDDIIRFGIERQHSSLRRSS